MLMVANASSFARQSPRQNHLIAALPSADYERLQPDLEPTPMPLGSVLCESGAHMSYVYFPTTSIVSLLYVMESGARSAQARSRAASSRWWRSAFHIGHFLDHCHIG